MITLDQLHLLQEKVETAVKRIAQLNDEVKQLSAENDALRSKCAELSNALDAKTELVSSLEADQGKIEESILDALNKLDTVENSILSGSSLSNEPTEYQAEESQESEYAEEAETSEENDTAPTETEMQQNQEEPSSYISESYNNPAADSLSSFGMDPMAGNSFESQGENPAEQEEIY